MVVLAKDELEVDISVEELESIPVLNPAVEVLEGAAQYIEKHGWCQGKVINRRRSVCLYGALTYGSMSRLEDLKRAEKALTKVLHTQCFATWNDTEGRTKEEVIGALRKAKNFV